MKALLAYFSNKPQRVVYAALWLTLLGVLAWRAGLLLYQAELFATLVHNPDHRMTPQQFTGLNSDHIRSSREADAFPEQDFNIVFLGDSFVYGFLLPQESMAPPAQLEQILREQYHRDDINVANFGWTSSSPFLSRRLLDDIGRKYHPDLILFALDMSDYRDEWFYQSVIQQRGFYRWVVAWPRSTFFLKHFLEMLSPWLDWHKRLFGYSGEGGYFVARQPMEVSRHLFDEIYASLLEMDKQAKAMNAPLVVFMPPRHWQYTDKEAKDSWENGGFDVMGPYALENYRYFAEKKTPFAFVPMLDDFREAKVFPLNFQVDSHWNKKGAHFFAERVAWHLQQLGVLAPLQTATQNHPATSSAQHSSSE